jgi:hypothetical protein
LISCPHPACLSCGCIVGQGRGNGALPRAFRPARCQCPLTYHDAHRRDDPRRAARRPGR